MSGDTPTASHHPHSPLRPQPDIAVGDLDLSRLQNFVAADRQRLLSMDDKSVPAEWIGRSIDSFATQPGSAELLPSPVMTLSRSALDQNLHSFAEWAAHHGVAHAPHGKTSMAPALWLEQLQAGAWAITVASEFQARIAVEAGVPRVLIANLVVRPGAVSWLADIQSTAEVICWVDSLAAVEQMTSALAQAHTPVPVLVELGTVRTGARSAAAAVAVAQAVAASEHLRLVGVGGYEGVAVPGHDSDDAAVIRDFLHTLVEVGEQIRPLIDGQLIITAGGSTWFDEVVEVCGSSTDDTLVVVRSGAVISHDDGTYLRSTPTARGRSGPQLHPALHVWSMVLSRPDHDRVILDAGKRDLPVDSGLPTPQFAVSSRPPTFAVLDGHQLIGTNDQHATMQIPEDSPLRVGDLVRLGISHPCTAFDKWRLIPVLNDSDAMGPVVVDWVRTWF